MLKPVPLAIIALAAGLGTAHAQVVVSSKIDTEGGVLGQIILQLLDHAGIPTRDRIQLGGTPILREAILAGEIDIYPEYTGNAAFFFNRADEPIWQDAAAGYQAARQLDEEANDIVWLAPAPANNTWGVALRSEVAEQAGVSTFSQFGEWVSGGGEVKLVASAEFVNSAPALPAFQRAYGFTLDQDQLLVLSGGDTAATIQAAANGTSGANAAMVYGTDGALAFSGLTVLEDDKNVQPVYQPAPIVRAEILAEYPQIAELLEPAFAGLDLEVLQRLNGQVQVEGLPAAEVAQAYLTEAGLLD
ncbi:MULTISPECIES: ABC transporter substrate-binding protein [Paracoccus]|uniref:glycine betaine ABC transporter substrate-binding protein OsmF n=1 Tax=Paracoccus TaxID=265 RepID=UPI00091C0422|nr:MULTISPECIES: ABC transporter substrate-binding protein [Paracoccus]MCJ1902190.1 ABC transporter substrate-binding protein [Paracoccus versutus]MDF3904102.1 ABC transporter substrate-binding protein [Paracoccus sp. AS002]SFX37476.1 osmoprotectant transport system substrate-binding protein [Paracoccus pantotrophus]